MSSLSPLSAARTGDESHSVTVMTREMTPAASFFRRLRQGVMHSFMRRDRRGDEASSTTSTSSSSRSPSISESTSSSPRRSSSSSSSSPTSLSKERLPSTYRLNQFDQILQSDNVDLNALRKLSWNGIPLQHRTIVWQLMLGYLPTNKSRREVALMRKRKEYLDSIPTYFDISDSDRTTQEGETLRQILVDLPRTSPNTPFFQQLPIQKAMERILYIWSIRHPARWV